MEGSSLQKVLFLLIAGVVLLCQLCQALPVVTEEYTETGNEIIDDPCDGLPCDEWREVQEKLSLLNAYEAKDAGSLLASYRRPGAGATSEPDGELPDILFTPQQIDELWNSVVGQKENREEEGQNHRREKRKVRSQESYRWELPIQYKIDAVYETSQKEHIRAAIQQWEDNTCVRFRELNLYEDTNDEHLKFTLHSSSCASYIGNIHVSSKSQPVYLAANCFSKFGTAVHEIGHALGLWHEHQRPSREGHITIMKENIISYYLSNFEEKEESLVESFNIPFDYNSVMHYGGKIGTNNGLHTILTADALFQGNIGQRVALSFLDAKAINHAYCDNFCNPDELKQACQHDGYQDVNDCSRCRCPPGVDGKYCETVAPPVAADCGGHFSLSTGESLILKSPGYDTPGYYDNDQECNWLLDVTHGNQLRVEFLNEFGVYSTGSGICMHWVEVKAGNDFSSPGPRFCGDELPEAQLQSENRELLLTFRSNYEVSFKGHRRGFKFRVIAVETDELKENSEDLEETTTTTATTTTTTTITTTEEPTTTKRVTDAPSETFGEWSSCSGYTLNCGCGGCGVRTRTRYCDGEECGTQTETCSRICVKNYDTYSYYIGKIYTKDCPECCPGFHRVGDVCQKD